MKVVLIGAGGFLGSSLLKGLSQGGEIKEWHLLYSSEEAFSHADYNSYCYVYRWPQHSLQDDAYKKIFIDADVIIYAAGAGIQPGKDVNDETIFNLNLFEPARLIQSLSKSGFQGQLISFGSYFESGENQPHEPLSEKAFMEQDNRLPNSYCRSKKELSHFHFVFQHIEREFKWLHLILTNIYGPGENENRLIPYIIKESKEGKPLHFTAGSQIRQYTYVGDVVEIVARLLGKGSGLYHLTNYETISIKTIIEETLQQVRGKLSIIPDVCYDLSERRDISMNYLAISPQKLLQDWGLSCPTSYQKGISSYFNL